MIKYSGIAFLLTILTFISTGSINAHRFSTSDVVLSERSGITRSNFEDSVKTLYHSLQLDTKGLNYQAFRYGMIGYNNLLLEGKLNKAQIISIIDFTKESTAKRFYTIDLKNARVLFNSLVSHGKNTGENVAKAFSNVPHSNKSSLGFYVTGETYVGSKGYSLKLDGLDGRFNDKMRSRAVVMHEANYVSQNWIKQYGRLGRSQGCPALPKEICRQVIDMIKGGTLIFAYYNDESYLSASTHLQLEKLWAKLEPSTPI